MSEKTTHTSIGGRAGPMEWGHVPHAEAVSRARKYYNLQLVDAQAALLAIDEGDIRVFHQRGVHVGRDRREVFAASESAVPQ